MPEDPNKGQGQDPKIVNQTAQDTIQSVTAKLKVAEDAIKTKDGKITDLEEKLRQANDVIEGFERAPLISDIVNKSDIPIEELSKKTTAELRGMLATLNAAKAPSVKSVRGQSTFDVENQTEGLTVGSLLGKKLGEK